MISNFFSSKNISPDAAAGSIIIHSLNPSGTKLNNDPSGEYITLRCKITENSTAITVHLFEKNPNVDLLDF